MVVGDLYIKCIAGPPREAHAVLIVDPDAMLTRPISPERLKMVPGWNFQVSQRYGCIQDRQILEGPEVKIRRQATALAGLPQPFSFRVAETRDHGSILTQRGSTVKR